ncbi:MAG TPA: EI24 domain-containing protein [Kofleriaceae bacterium]|nr:EI24 domain-containing protein [Kofleriaceae bacterium]
MRQVLLGAGDAARGLRYLVAHPRLFGWVVAPALVTLVVIVGVVWAVLALSAPAVAWIAAGAPDWLASWLSGLLRLLVVGGLSVIGFLFYVSISGALAGPFCEMLSESVEERVTGVPAPGFSAIAFARGVLLGVLHAARRLAIYLVALGLLLVLGALIPGVGHAIAAVVGFTLAAQTAAYDCYDAVFGRRLWRYRQKTDYLRAHRGRTLGLGAAVAALLLIPFLNLVALGLGAAGATLAFLDLDEAAR